MPQKNPRPNKLYENTVLIITEYERAAMSNMTRESLLSTARGPLSAAERLIDFQVRVIDEFNARRPGTDAPVTGPGNGIDVDVEFELGDVLGGNNNVSDAVNNYLSECLGCNTRVRFSWQVQPANILADYQAMLDQLEAIAQGFASAVQPDRVLPDLCRLLNSLNLVCVADHITILAALNFMLRRYLTQSINLRIDWTVLLGPLIHFITGAINGLFAAIQGVILAPMDCFLTVVRLAMRGAQTAGALASTFNQPSFTFSGTAGFTQNEVQIREGLGNYRARQQIYAPDPEQTTAENARDLFLSVENVSTTDENGAPEITGADITFFTGGKVRGAGRLQSIAIDPKFTGENAMVKLGEVVKEAMREIRRIIARVNGAFAGLNSLVGDGLQLDLSNLGAMLLILDIISLIRAIIILRQQNPDVRDWCEFLEENPGFLAQAVGPGLEAETDRQNQRILLRRGPKVVSYVDTCANKRSLQDQDLIQSWIDELNGKLK